MDTAKQSIIFVKWGVFYEVFGPPDSFQIQICQNLLQMSTFPFKYNNVITCSIPIQLSGEKFEILRSHGIHFSIIEKEHFFQ
jgi:hypothetical protein